MTKFERAQAIQQFPVEDWANVIHFFKIVKTYLKMKQMQENEFLPN
jgi:hypothetical protein